MTEYSEAVPASTQVRRPFRISQTSAVALIIGFLFAALVLPPVYVLIQTSLATADIRGQPTGFTLDHYIRLFTNPRLLESAWNSFVFAAASTVLTLLYGGTLAWVVERTNTPFKTLAYLTTIISLGTPYILYVSAWIFLLGGSGPINGVLKFLLNSDSPVFSVHSMWGMVLIEGVLWSPMVFLLLSATFRNANAEMEEAARMSGAGVWDTVWHISVKLSLPAILALAIFVLIRAIEAFEVPAMVGLPGRVNVLTTDVYTYLKETVPPDLGYASAFSVLLLAIMAVLLFYYSRVSRNAEKYSTITGKGYRPRTFDLGRGRWVGAALVLFHFFIVLLLPLIALLWLSVMPYMQGFSLAGLGRITFKNYVTVLNAPYYIGLAWNTFILAAGSATVCMILTVIAGWLSARRKAGGMIIDYLASLPLIFPGIIMSVATMIIFLALPIPIYGTIWIIFIAYITRYLPYGMRYTYTGVLQIHRELEEAAGVSGASPLKSLRLIIAPLLSPAILAGWLFIFLVASKELAVAILLAGPRSQTVSVAMYDLWVNGQGGELAALGLIWTGLMTVVAMIFYINVRRDSQRTMNAA